MPKCDICLDVEESGLHCSGPAPRHFVCETCLQEHVITIAEEGAKLEECGGAIPCSSGGAGGCAARWQMDEIFPRLNPASTTAIARAFHALYTAPARREADAAARRAAEIAAGAANNMVDRVNKLRNVIIERVMILRCPRCAAAFNEHEGCPHSPALAGLESVPSA